MCIEFPKPKEINQFFFAYELYFFHIIVSKEFHQIKSFSSILHLKVGKNHSQISFDIGIG